MDKIAQDGFYFHFFEKLHNKVKMLNLHGWEKTINMHYDKNTSLICLSCFP